MVEGELNEAQEDELIEALKVAHEVIKDQCQVLKELEAAVGKTEKRSYQGDPSDPELGARVRASVTKVYAVAQQGSAEQAGSEGRLQGGSA